MAERKATFETGKYADNNGPGKGGLWFVKRKVEEMVAYAESSGEAEQIADAFRAKEKARA